MASAGLFHTRPSNIGTTAGVCMLVAMVIAPERQFLQSTQALRACCFAFNALWERVFALTFGLIVNLPPPRLYQQVLVARRCATLRSFRWPICIFTLGFINEVVYHLFVWLCVVTQKLRRAYKYPELCCLGGRAGHAAKFVVHTEVVL